MFAIVLTTTYDNGEPVLDGDLVALEYDTLSKQFPSKISGLGIHSGSDSSPLTSTAIGWLGPDEIEPALAAFCDQPDTSVSTP